MKTYRLTFGAIIFFSLFALVIQYILTFSLFDNNNLLFENYGDDYYYLNNFKYYDPSDIVLTGLAKLYQITPYNAFLYYVLTYFGFYGYFILETILFVYSNYCFYKICQSCLTNNLPNYALALHLILPLRYIWLFSYYKDSILLSCTIVLIYFIVYNQNQKLKYLFSAVIFLIRPFSLIIILIANGIKKKYLIGTIALLTTLITLFLFVFDDYSYFFRKERTELIISKLSEIPFNDTGVLNWIAPIFIVVFTLIQPLPIFDGASDIYSKIDTIAQIDGIIKLIITPSILLGLFYIKKFYMDKKISFYLKLLLLNSLFISIGFLFLTNRHILAMLPWQIIFSLYVIQEKGFKTIGLICLFAGAFLLNVMSR